MSEKSPDFIPHIKKISPGENEYLEYLKEQKKFVEESDNKVFGDNFLLWSHSLKRWRETGWMQKQDSKGNERYEKNIEKLAIETTKQFHGFLSSENTLIKKSAEEFIRRGLEYSDDARLHARMFLLNSVETPELFHGKQPEEIDWLAEEISTSIQFSSSMSEPLTIDRSLPGNIWTSLVEGNMKALNESQRALQEKYLPQFLEQFRHDVPVLLEKYGISKDEALNILSRLNSVAFRVADSLSSSLESTSGSHSVALNDIIINAAYVSEEHKEELHEILNHEFFHAISGRLVYKTTYSADDNDADYDVWRSGLHFQPQHLTQVKGQDRFSWLNEAVTQRLTLELLNKKSEESKLKAYEDEMGTLDDICEKGGNVISFQLFAEAYFEDYEPAEKNEITIPKWKALQKAVKESLGPNFLTRLDKESIRFKD